MKEYIVTNYIKDPDGNTIGERRFTIPQETVNEIRADERRKFAEWMYKSQYHGFDADMKERKDYTIRRWIEDFEKEQKE